MEEAADAAGLTHIMDDDDADEDFSSFGLPATSAAADLSSKAAISALGDDDDDDDDDFRCSCSMHCLAHCWGDKPSR